MSLLSSGISQNLSGSLSGLPSTLFFALSLECTPLLDLTALVLGSLLVLVSDLLQSSGLSIHNVLLLLLFSLLMLHLVLLHLLLQLTLVILFGHFTVKNKLVFKRDSQADIRR